MTRRMIQFRNDIKELLKVKISPTVFRKVLQSTNSVEDLQWALSAVYDHWNFTDGHPIYRQYMELLEGEIETCKRLRTKRSKEEKETRGGNKCYKEYYKSIIDKNQK